MSTTESVFELASKFLSPSESIFELTELASSQFENLSPKIDSVFELSPSESIFELAELASSQLSQFENLSPKIDSVFELASCLTAPLSACWEAPITGPSASPN